MQNLRVAVLLLSIVSGAVSCSDGEPGAADVRLFTRLPSSETGVTFANSLQVDAVMNGFTYEYYYNGGGVAVGDLTGDGLPELYFTGNRVRNRLYLNLGGLRFEDISDRSGVQGHTGWATGVTFADVNADGRLDIHVSYSGAYDDADLRRNQVFINEGMRDGVPTFTERAAELGLDDRGLTTQAAFFDQDLDGDLDAYVMNHGIAGYHTLAELKAGRSPQQLDRFYRNEGGRFEDVSDEVGLIDTNLGFGLGLSVSDVNGDGRPDVYVANDYSGRDYLYLGRADGRFDETLRESMAHIPFASMGSDFADIDGDGRLDLFVAEMAMESHYDRSLAESGVEGSRFANVVAEGQHYQYVANTLQWNRGERDGVPVFSEIAQLAGVARTDWSWSALFADLDNDGRPDLFVTTGTPADMVHGDFQAFRRLRTEEVLAAEGRVTHSLMVELLQNMPARLVPNRVFRNEGELQFSDRTEQWAVDAPSYSHGAVYADLDRDGDLDLVVNNLMAEAAVYRNESRAGDGARMLGVRLAGPRGNAFGVGARVRLVAGGAQQTQELQLTRGYQSSVEPVLHFGLGRNEVVDTLEVTWPDGARETRTGVEADQYLTLERSNAATAAAGVPASSATRAAAPPLFGRPGRLVPGLRHVSTIATTDSTLESYPSLRDPLALAVGDLDGDGRDDVLFGGNPGEPPRIWLQQADGSLRGDATLPQPPGTPTAAAIFDADRDGRADVLLALPGRLILYRNGGGAGFRVSTTTLPAPAGTVSVLAAHDHDGDGDVDLFVGSRSIPGEDVAGSQLLRNDGDAFVDVTAGAAAILARLGTVTDALWADIDRNGRADLIVVGEWMPVTVLLNDGSALRDATAETGVSEDTGWWQSVVAADFDGDGDLDIVAGNMGLNAPWIPSHSAPLELYASDFDGDGRREMIPAWRDGGAVFPWLDRDRLVARIPPAAERFRTRHDFGRATLASVLGPNAMADAGRWAARTLASAYLENDGRGRFTTRPLPAAAQVAPINGMVAADFDGDGALDLVLGGNMHELHAKYPRADAGMGLLLRGDGTGSFTAISPGRSGLLLNGRVHGFAAVRTGVEAPALLVAIAGGEALYLRAIRGPAAGSAGISARR